jgi:hypothetical protein
MFYNTSSESQDRREEEMLDMLIIARHADGGRWSLEMQWKRLG